MGTFRISACLGSGVQGAEQKRIDRAAFAGNARLQALFAAGRERVSPRPLAGAAVSVKRSWFLTRLQGQLASYRYFSRSLRALSKIRNSIHAADARTPARLEAAIGDLRKALKREKGELAVDQRSRAGGARRQAVEQAAFLFLVQAEGAVHGRVEQEHDGDCAGIVGNAGRNRWVADATSPLHQPFSDTVIAPRAMGAKNAAGHSG